MAVLLGAITLGGILSAPAAGDHKPWHHKYKGSDWGTAQPPEKFHVTFDVSSKKRIVDLEVRNLNAWCEFDGEERPPGYHFGPIEFTKAPKIDSVGNDEGFAVTETFDDGFGGGGSYEVEVQGRFENRYKRVMLGVYLGGQWWDGRNCNFWAFYGKRL